MFFIRKIAKLLRGEATPFQLFMACLLGGLLAFIPNPLHAPGLFLSIVFLLIILNANLFLSALIGGVIKLVALAATPFAYELGRYLVDGPLQPYFKNAINSPGLAYFGFDYYVIPGGLILGAGLGIVFGWIVLKIISGFRKKVADLEENSEKYKEWTEKKWVKLTTKLIIGGKSPKKSYNELLKKKMGNPIRILGVVFVALFCLVVYASNQLLTRTIVSSIVQDTLERFNGATVDLEYVDINWKSGQIEMANLAMADPEKLTTDLLRVEKVEADLNIQELLRKHFVMDKVVLRGATHGETRTLPAGLVRKEPWITPKDKDPNKDETDDNKIDDYIEQYEVWRQRLAQAREWMQYISGDEEAKKDDKSLEEWLEEEIREKGYNNVRAEHLIADAPTIWIRELSAEKVRTEGINELNDETLDIHGRHLSTHPKVLGLAPTLEIISSGKTLEFILNFSGVAASADESKDNAIALAFRRFPADKAFKQLKSSGEAVVQGGTIDFEGVGLWEPAKQGSIEFPLTLTLRNPNIRISGDMYEIEELAIPVEIYGVMDRPRIKVDGKALQASLLKAGQQAALGLAKTKGKELLQKELGDQYGGALGDAVGNWLGGKPADENADKSDGSSTNATETPEDELLNKVFDLFKKKQL
jgi:uncharacterized protein (TIGR03546 family)